MFALRDPRSLFSILFDRAHHIQVHLADVRTCF